MADHTHDTTHEHPANPLPYYAGVFGLLMVLTGLTVGVAYFDLGEIFEHVPVLGHFSGILNAIVALTIAAIKALAVILIFMHVRWSSRLTQVIVVGAVFWLLIMLSFTISDYLTRGGWPTGLGEY
ncbi:MAG TPA: cytochrome C oxidase subunit IV family protein [Blastocatellia bacterium]|nr:cytochrome C oxidase subunit IV family protein [Blastocatellia bacterium]